MSFLQCEKCFLTVLPSCSAVGQEVTTEQEVSSAEAKEGEKTEAGGTKDPEEKAVLEDVDGPEGYVRYYLSVLEVVDSITICPWGLQRY